MAHPLLDLNALVQDYADQHQHPKNALTHMVGIPLIIFSIMLILSWIAIDIASTIRLTFAWLLSIAVIIYYCKMNLKVGSIMGLFYLVLLLISHLCIMINHGMPLFIVAIICFIVGWCLQFIGHIFEKKRPAFMRNLIHLLIGPIFIVMEILAIWKIQWMPKPLKSSTDNESLEQDHTNH